MAGEIMTETSGSAGGELAALRERVREFAQERDWEKYHHPRSLVLALMGEVGELAEIFQWLGDDLADAVMNDPEQARCVREELADVFCYLLRLSDVLDVDLGEALAAKMKVNAERYPVDLARGNATKYTELRG